MLRRFQIANHNHHSNKLAMLSFSSSSSSSTTTLRFKCTEDPEKAQMAGVLGPIPYKVKKGKKYFWCSCGASKNQPFCDGSHVKFNKANGTNFKSVPYENTDFEDRFVAFCTCKRTKDQPLCDGSHNEIDT